MHIVASKPRGTCNDPLLTFTIRYFTLIRSRTPWFFRSVEIVNEMSFAGTKIPFCAISDVAINTYPRQTTLGRTFIVASYSALLLAPA